MGLDAPQLTGIVSFFYDAIITRGKIIFISVPREAPPWGQAGIVLISTDICSDKGEGEAYRVSVP